MMTMVGNEHSSIQTRPSLLNRLRKGDDTESWHEFYRIYGKLVRDFAIQAGLTDTEADEVVQETAIAMARNLPEFRYDPPGCRFKTWLLNQAAWRLPSRSRSSSSKSDLRRSLGNRAGGSRRPKANLSRPCLRHSPRSIFWRFISNPFRVEFLRRRRPRVARFSQPWALGRNPFGILPPLTHQLTRLHVFGL